MLKIKYFKIKIFINSAKIDNKLKQSTNRRYFFDYSIIILVFKNFVHLNIVIYFKKGDNNLFSD